MLGIALDGNDENSFRLVGVNVDGKSEVGGQVAAHLMPGVAAIVAAHHVPMLLHEENVGARPMHGDAMNAVADFGGGIGKELGFQAAVDGPPGLPAIVGAKGARGGDGDEHAVGIGLIENDGMQAHAAGSRLPARPGAVAAQSGKFLPGQAAVGGAE